MASNTELNAWCESLKQELYEAIKKSYKDRWGYSLTADKGLACDFVEIEGQFEIQRVIYDEPNEELVVHAKIGMEVNTRRDVHELVHKVLSLSDEEFCVFVPLHTEDTLQYWFATGFYSHSHTGRIIIDLKENPHIQMS